MKQENFEKVEEYEKDGCKVIIYKNSQGYTFDIWADDEKIHQSISFYESLNEAIINASSMLRRF